MISTFPRSAFVSLLAIGLSGLLLVLAGCEGDTGPVGPAGADGSPGLEGPPGQPGGPLPPATADEVPDLVATISSVTIASEPVVRFTLADSKGNQYRPVSPEKIRQLVAELATVRKNATNRARNRWRDGAPEQGGGRDAEQDTGCSR